jgi:uncharacterized protein YaiL (DUF2058 family)
MSNIPFLTGEEVINTNNIVASLNKTFAKMTAKETSTTSNKYAFEMRHENPKNQRIISKNVLWHG